MPTPFVPWHQPFWNEAGVYTATVVVPAEQKVACGATVKSESTAGGKQTLVYHPHVGRDFALTCSADYREYTATTRTPATFGASAGFFGPTLSVWVNATACEVSSPMMPTRIVGTGPRPGLGMAA